MMPLVRVLLPLALGLAAAFLVACGDSGGLLTGDRASGLSGKLDAVSQAEAGGDCSGARSQAHQLKDEINQVHGLKRKLRSALRDGAQQVLQQAAVDCTRTSTTAPSTTSATPTSQSTSTTPTTTTPTTSSTNTNTGTTSTTPTNTGPTGGGAGPGGGNGKGNGGGNGGAGAGGGKKKKKKGSD